ncbi:MAG TPA: valine--tRNA ligase [Ferruginibacter sp.]|nr:valine--tRNA ligase [Ferruginibacter sp.]
MELSKNFEPASIETKWYKHWLDKKYFNSHVDNRPAFTVVIPPPNVTGVLHMGHTLNETVQDVLVRKARMSGFNACWVPGSDHASIATEAKVVAMLKEKGIEKNNLTREEFLKYAFEWKDKYGGIIYNQIERLGCSVDWNRTTFTMDDHYYKAVIKIFIDLYNKGLIYRGARMINWDSSARTALSDEEVEYKDITGKLYYLKYRLEDANGNTIKPLIGDDGIIIATQRPETIMGDTAICVNPNDERYKILHGMYAVVPLINRRIPIIFDDYVDTAFGTGALKVTPAHDINDYNLGLKHHLEIIDTINEDGTMSPAAQIYVGEDRFIARKKIIKELQEKGFLLKEEEYTTRLGYSQRTGVVVEPRISTQWFVKMKELAQPALKAVVEADIKIHPGDKFLATYKYWLENVKDWCISRQLWWGQQIPAWYDESGKMVVAETMEEAKKIFETKFAISNASLTQDADVLDTWFSSWLWPIEVFKGITNPGNDEIKYYYPAAVLVTGQDIIFFWVARMVMAGMQYEKQIPFKDVYFTGMVRDKLGRKMSKSLGNSPDLLELIDKYGADAVRFGILVSSPAGNDLMFDENSLEQGRNFNNKIWNALKLVKMWEGRQATDKEQQATENFAINWFQNRLHKVKTDVDELMKQFRLSEALKTIYNLIWDDFCSWYLEWIKPGFEQPVDTSIYEKTIGYFEELMQLLHPYMPFVTEEIYHLLKNQKDDLCIKQFATVNNVDDHLLAQGELLKQVITTIRDGRNKNQLKPKETIKLFIETGSKESYKSIEGILSKQVNADELAYTTIAIDNTIVLAVEKDKFYLKTNKKLDTALLKADLLKDLEHQKGFLLSVEKKLSNEKFVSNAKPEVIALEQKKKTDAEARIKTIEESLSTMR